MLLTMFWGGMLRLQNGMCLRQIDSESGKPEIRPKMGENVLNSKMEWFVVLEASLPGRFQSWCPIKRNFLHNTENYDPWAVCLPSKLHVVSAFSKTVCALAMKTKASHTHTHDHTCARTIGGDFGKTSTTPTTLILSLWKCKQIKHP